jgi:hypothetical protein
MYSDADVDAIAARLRSPDAAVRALAADEATDGVSDWEHHSYTASQATEITSVLVDALTVETDAIARESIVNALATLVSWGLAPISDVRRAASVPRARDDLTEYWRDIDAWAAHQD